MKNADGLPEPPRAGGVRTAWRDLPGRIRSEIEHRAGVKVVGAESQPGGFSPGLASRLVTASGRRIFVKAVSGKSNPESPGIHRREALIASLLPEAAPVPRMLWSFDEGGDGWVVLAFEDIEGRLPRQPWRLAELRRVVGALDTLARSLTPSPVGEEVCGTVSGHLAKGLRGWRLLLDEPALGLDPWSLRNLERLAELEDAAPEGAGGNTLVHLDSRADNTIITPERVYFVDWAHARIGPPWTDIAAMAPSVAMQGGPEPEDLLAMSPVAAEAHPRALTAFVASIAGYFTHRALQTPPPGLPTVRAFQAGQGAAARRWLALRTGWK